MKQIKNLKKLTSINSGWNPADIAFINSLEWSQGNAKIVFYCQNKTHTDGWPDLTRDFIEVVFKFKNVIQLNLNFSSNKIQQVTGFDILDISMNGLQNINFRIEDYEDNIISFNCEEVEIEKVSDPGILALNRY